MKSAISKKCVRNTHNREIAIQVRGVRIRNANFNLPKMHLVNHYAESVNQFRPMAQYSTNITELLHKALIKNAYNSINTTGNLVMQMLEHNIRHESLASRELNWH